MRAVLLDVLGTLLRMDAPGPRLRTELERTLERDVGQEAADRAFGAEIAYYLEHQLEGGNRHGLERLRDGCAEVVRQSLGLDPATRPAVREAMLAALHFEPWPDVAPALGELREAGVRVVAASNWDCSLPDFLASAGLADLLEGAVASAVVGAPKPDPAVFRAALAVAGCSPEDALHVGDSIENDVEGARAAGIGPVLLARDGRPDAPAGVPTIRTLEELPALVLSGR